MNIKNFQNRGIILFVIVLFIGLGSLSCEGPMGPQGPRGEQGPPGPIGPAGSEGSIIHAGEGIPDEETGSTGDFYLDLTTGNLFGPKMAEGWGAPFNLIGNEGPQGPQGPKGPEGPQGPAGEDGEDGQDGENGQDGEDGEDGSQIYAGNGTPDNNQGQEGDYYLDKTSYDLYGPKTGSDWGNPINLQGPKGDQGEEGTANVIYSDWIQHPGKPALNQMTIDNDKVFYFSISAPEVTQDILNEGIVLVYRRDVDINPNSFRMLPVSTFGDQGYSFGPITIDFLVTQPGSILITYFFYETNTPTVFSLPDHLGDIYYRYVIIPDGMPAKMRPGFPEDYQAVKEYYGIPD